MSTFLKIQFFIRSEFVKLLSIKYRQEFRLKSKRNFRINILFNKIKSDDVLCEKCELFLFQINNLCLKLILAVKVDVFVFSVCN